MDRLPRSFFACGLGLLLLAAGCKATRTEVPPGRPFAKDGQQRPAISFSSDGHAPSGPAAAGLVPNGLGGSDLASGIGSRGARPDASNFGAPPGAYGPPGTAGSGLPPNLNDPAMTRASGAPAPMPPAGPSPVALPPLDAPAPNGMPSPAARDVPNQVIQAPLDKPGAMGTPEQMPSPF